MKLMLKTILVALCVFGLPETKAQLNANYYSVPFTPQYCPELPVIVQTIVSAAVIENERNAAELLRLFFHDCFVEGCDGSVLIFSPKGTAERDGAPNANSLGGFSIIDQIKTALHPTCPLVSCADIVALAARAAFIQVTNPLFDYDLPLGRGDGNISLASEANNNLPSPFANITTLKAMFAAKGLNTQQLVVLSGAHTIGTNNCTVVNPLIYNSKGDPFTSPIYSASFASNLRQQCAFNTKSVRIAMKQQLPFSAPFPFSFSSNLTFDNSYYYNLAIQQGMFPSDHALTTSNDTLFLVNFYSDPFNLLFFLNDFGSAMIQMGNAGVKPGGYARRNCSVAFS